MKIESFHIQGFKSIADLKVDGLSDINIFFGLNSVGKSNVFQALALWNRVVTSQERLSVNRLDREFGSPIFSLLQNDKKEISLQVTLNLEDSEKNTIYPSLYIDSLTTRTTIRSQSDYPIETQVGFFIGGEYQTDALQHFPQVWPHMHIIEASRRFQVEVSRQKAPSDRITDQNLKQTLFNAYLSHDLDKRRRLAAIRNTLNNAPFELGELDIAFDPDTQIIDVGFISPNGRLPIENVGSGVQQLLLMLGQVFFNDYPIIALEEPEMNLSPQYQGLLLSTLRQLMQDPAVKLNQLFISTHSPYLELQENFYDVTRDEQGYTQVRRASRESHQAYFAITPTGPDTGARVNSLNQVKLYDRLMEDLALQRGDLVFFLKNENGRWEIRPETDVLPEVDDTLNGSAKQEE